MSRGDKYTQEARLALSYAREETKRLNYRLINNEHLLLAILRVKDPLVEGLFASVHTTSTRIARALDFVIGRGTKAILAEPNFSPAARASLARAAEAAASTNQTLIGVEHILLGILGEQDGVIAGVLESYGITLAIAQQLMYVQPEEEVPFSVQYETLYEETPTLNQMSRDLTMMAQAGRIDPLIGREAELERVMQILSRRTKNNPVLIGPSGVGKTAIAEGLALRIVQGQVPDNLRNCRVVELEIGLLTVGTKFRGDFEERLQQLMQEIVNTPGIIVVIDELHSLVKAGVAEGSLDAANLFKPMLARGDFHCLGATTLDEYRKTIETDPALERRFQPVMVAETNYRETLDILYALRTHYANFHHVTISDEALNAAVRLSSRYIQNRYLPDKAIDLLDEASSRVSVQRSIAPDTILALRDELVSVQRDKDYAIAHHDFANASRLLKRERQCRQLLWQAEHEWHLELYQHTPTVVEQDIAEVVALWTGIPVVQISSEDAERLLHLEDELHQRIVGQHAAVQAVARAVRRSRTDVRDSRRPIGSFLFVGPTGVGKTELAKALATVLFGDENALLKLDMSEFMESHLASRLVGAPPGYVGYDQAGQLTEAVRRRPYTVVLLDEIEKAHPKVFDLLLQILEEGCLTDAQSHKVDFKHAIIIMTTNTGAAQLAQHHMAFSRAMQKDQRHNAYSQVMPEIQALFRPELLNRIDEIILFQSLTQEEIRTIVDLMIAQLQQRVHAQEITMQVSDAARDLLLKHGYDQEYGARALRRTVQRMLEDMLAEAILHGTLSPGCSITIDVLNDALCLRELQPSKALVPVQNLAVQGA